MSVTLLDFEGAICSMALFKDWKTTLTTPSIGDHPHQPSDFNFPRREFGQQSKVKPSFKVAWFKQWNWLHYDEEKDAAFCSVLATPL